MGRVYEAAELERPGGRHGVEGPAQFVTTTGHGVGFSRVEFDEDADRGPAAVTTTFPSGHGGPLTYRDEAGELKPVEVTFRAVGRVVPARG